MNQTAIIFIILFLFNGCLRDDDLKLATIEYNPEFLGDGWQIEAASSATFNMDLLNDILNKIYSEDDFVLLHSLLIVKNGKLMVESYTRSYSDRNTPHHVWSVTKSFTSLLTGIAIDKGLISNVNDSVFRYIPEYISYAYPELKPLTIKECLLMQSGINYSNDGLEEDEVLASVPSDLTRYILQRPMNAKPGEQAYYKNSDPQLLVKVVSNATSTDFVVFARENLFRPMGITNYFWSRNKKDNTPYGCFGLWMTPRDLAKIGQLFINKGTWDNQRIISEQWLIEASSSQTTIDGFDYGYFFWVAPEKNYFWAWGAGGQFIFVIPHKDMVVVITSDQFADNQNTTIKQATYLVDKIIESAKD
ncbi:MAG TPA: serine hydrolase [Chitinispirillaceae bacterium]|nr:serine hydrolase [Chitinispirillaceae bacterium]